MSGLFEMCWLTSPLHVCHRSHSSDHRTAGESSAKANSGG